MLHKTFPLLITINLFADDRTVMTYRKQHVSDSTLLDELRDIQSRTHKWSVRNQVEFDPGKEYFKILHPSLGLGEEFKLLGTLFDVALSMTPCIDAILARVRPKIRALLRPRDM